ATQLARPGTHHHFRNGTTRSRLLSATQSSSRAAPCIGMSRSTPVVWRGWGRRSASTSIEFFFSSSRRHTRSLRDWSSDVCSSDLALPPTAQDQNGFVVELEQFSGPLDLLLHLIHEDEVDITDLPIAKIADQFLAVISELGLNQAADYLEMAARLLRIKAQMLLPRHLGDDEWEDPRAELVRRLLEYQQIRELVEWLGQATARRAEKLGRGFRPEPPGAPPAPLVIELNELLAAAERVIALIPEPVLHRVVPRPLDVEGATERIQALLAEREECAWADVVGERPSVVDVLSAFIALLELAKRGALKLRQDE